MAWERTEGGCYCLWDGKRVLAQIVPHKWPNGKVACWEFLAAQEQIGVYPTLKAAKQAWGCSPRPCAGRLLDSPAGRSKFTLDRGRNGRNSCRT